MNLHEPKERSERVNSRTPRVLGQYVEFREADGKIFTQNSREYPKTEGQSQVGAAHEGLPLTNVDWGDIIL